MPDLHDLEHAFAENLVAEGRRSDRTFPLKREVAALADELLGLLFSQLSDHEGESADELQARLTLILRDLRSVLASFIDGNEVDGVVREFDLQLPALHDQLQLDAEAILAGDPAAESLDEVIVAYPGFLAIAIHRLAHALHRLRVRVLPRLLAEVAHTRTGIDIHPGAEIGRSFCIDHGTGVVVGETAIVGDNVKLYQGVTLGAHSVAKRAAGSKRHPTIGNRVVIYANATVLGGDTVVGDDSVVGGNVFLTSSVPPNSIVYHTSQVRVRRVRDGFEDADFVI